MNNIYLLLILVLSLRLCLLIRSNTPSFKEVILKQLLETAAIIGCFQTTPVNISDPEWWWTLLKWPWSIYILIFLLLNLLTYFHRRTDARSALRHILILFLYFSAIPILHFGFPLVPRSTIQQLFHLPAIETKFIIVIGFLLSANEANILIRLVMSYLNILPEDRTDNAVAKARLGRVIGVLERALIYLFVLAGQFSTIGFILTAKGIMRFPEISEDKNRNVVEYVLVGTLLSASIAVFIAIIVQHFCGTPSIVHP